MTIDVERIKEYNKRYKESQSKVANLQAELDMNNREIDRLCKELSAELGITINRENVEQVYMQKVQEINSNLELGESILKRIESEEKGLKSSSELEGELRIKTGGVNTTGNAGMIGNTGNAGVAGIGAMGVMPNMGNMGAMPQMNTMGGNAGMVGNAGFDSLGGMPQIDIKADEQPVNQGGGVKNPFISQAMGSPVIPQMFSRNGGDVPSLNESDFDSI